MASDRLAKVSPGDPLRFPAETYNTLMEVAREYLDSRHDQASGPRGMTRRRGDIIKIRNDSGSAQERFYVLKLNGLAITEIDNLEEFQNQPMLLGVTPTATTDNVAVLIDPANTDEFARAVISGIVPVQVNVTDTTHGFAVPTVSDASKLTSGTTGLFRILYKPSGTGTKWCLVRVGDAQPASIGSSLAIEAFDGTPALAAATKLRFIEDTGILLSATGFSPFEMTMSLLSSTRLVFGVLDLSDQICGSGTKTFFELALRNLGVDDRTNDPVFRKLENEPFVSLLTRASNPCELVFGNSSSGGKIGGNASLIYLQCPACRATAETGTPPRLVLEWVAGAAPVYAIEDVGGTGYNGVISGIFNSLDRNTVRVRGGIITNLTEGSGVAPGVGTLNTLTGTTQTFASANDTNVTLAISSVTTTHTFTMGWTGSLAVARGGTGATSATTAFDNLAPTTTKGDLIVHNGSDNIREAVGANDQTVIADSVQASGIKWGTLPIAGGGTGQTVRAAAFDALAPASAATGDIMYYDGASWIRLAAGTAGQKLTMSGGVPAWVT